MLRPSRLPLAALLAVMAAVPASADVIERYHERETRWEARFVCGEAAIGPDVFLQVCGSVIDQNGDGAIDEARVTRSRTECAGEGSERTCAGEGTSADVEPSDVDVDLDAGTAHLSAVVDGCAIELDATRTGDDHGYEFESGGNRPRLRDLSLNRYSATISGSEEYAANVAGSICDEHSGAFSDGRMARYYDDEVDQGARLHPEELPVAGAATEHGTRERPPTTEARACGTWFTSGEGQSDYAGGCASHRDTDEDGAIDAAPVGLWREECEGESCSYTIVEFSVDPSSMTFDRDAPSATVDASQGGCRFAIDLTGSGRPRYASYRTDRDTLRLERAAELELGLGSTRRYEMEEHPASVGPGPVVCGWDLDHYEREVASIQFVDISGEDWYLSAHPERIGRD